MSNKPTHFENESGHIVRSNPFLDRDWKLLGLKPLFIYEGEAEEPSKAMTVQELKAMCKERGIKGYSAMKEAELLEALKAEG